MCLRGLSLTFYDSANKAMGSGTTIGEELAKDRKTRTHAARHGLQKGLGGTKVFFNGIEAWMTLASDGQINVVVPYGVSGKADVTVQFNGKTSDPFPLAVGEGSGPFTPHPRRLWLQETTRRQRDGRWSSEEPPRGPCEGLLVWIPGFRSESEPDEHLRYSLGTSDWAAASKNKGYPCLLDVTSRL
jgi:uncharacterized protein (TIGR03437 family)